MGKESLMSLKVQVRPKSRLGRGLSSLISISDLSAEAEVSPTPASAPSVAATVAVPVPPTVRPTSTSLEVPVGSIVPNPHQPRRSFDDASIAELAASIHSTGLIQPVLV